MSAISNKPCSFSLEKLRISIVSNPAQISDDEEEILPTESSVVQDCQQARTLLNNNNLKGALSMINSIIDSNPNDIRLMAEKAGVLWMIGDYEQADICAATAVHLNPKDYNARLLRGKCCEDRRDLLNARLAYKEVQLVTDDANKKRAANVHMQRVTKEMQRCNKIAQLQQDLGDKITARPEKLPNLRALQAQGERNCQEGKQNAAAAVASADHLQQRNAAIQERNKQRAGRRQAATAAKASQQHTELDAALGLSLAPVAARMSACPDPLEIKLADQAPVSSTLDPDAVTNDLIDSRTSLSITSSGGNTAEEAAAAAIVDEECDVVRLPEELTLADHASDINHSSKYGNALLVPAQDAGVRLDGICLVSKPMQNNSEDKKATCAQVLSNATSSAGSQQNLHDLSPQAVEGKRPGTPACAEPNKIAAAVLHFLELNASLKDVVLMLFKDPKATLAMIEDMLKYSMPLQHAIAIVCKHQKVHPDAAEALVQDATSEIVIEPTTDDMSTNAADPAVDAVQQLPAKPRPGKASSRTKLTDSKR